MRVAGPVHLRAEGGAAARLALYDLACPSRFAKAALVPGRATRRVLRVVDLASRGHSTRLSRRRRRTPRSTWSAADPARHWIDSAQHVGLSESRPGQERDLQSSRSETT